MGKKSEARAAIEAAGRSLSDVRRGFRWMRRLDPRWEKEVPYFSLVRVRIVRAVPSSERLSEHGDAAFRAWGRFLGKLTSFQQDIDAEILEVQAIGKAYPPWSIKGRLHPSRKRSDIRVGQKIELSNNALETRIRINKTHQGQEFWLVISPPMAIKGIPRLVGGVGRSNILFALPARKR